MMEGTEGSWSPRTYSSEAERDECWCSFCFHLLIPPGTLAHRTVPLTFMVGLLTSVHLV